MSLYKCIDAINEQLNYKKPEKSDFVQRFGTFVFNDKEASLVAPSPHNISFLNQLKEHLQKRISSENYTHLAKDIKLIEAYCAKQDAAPILICLNSILDDLNEIKIKFERTQNLGTSSLGSKEYQKFQTAEYKIAELRQSSAYMLGNSVGECYGFTYGMVDPATSPYKNPGLAIRLNQKMHDYQKNQSDRIKDQDLIKKTRLTREYFCPDIKKQAEELAQIALQCEGQELGLVRRDKTTRHICYLSQQSNGKIRYMDPNHGAYLFKNKEDFISFYVLAAKEEKKAGVDFRFYQVNQLQYDKEHQLVASHSFMGKIRALLTGSKYQDGDDVLVPVNNALYFIGGATMGAVIGGLIGSLVPVVGTIWGAIIGGAVGGFGMVQLSNVAANQGHKGILGVPHMLMDQWQNLKEKIADVLSFKKDVSHSKTAANGVSCSSTAKILASMPKKAESTVALHEPSIRVQNNSQSGAATLPLRDENQATQHIRPAVDKTRTQPNF